MVSLEKHGRIRSEINQLNKKGIEMVKSRNYDEAIAYFDEALKINPRNETSSSNKVSCLISAGRLDEAVQCCDEFLKVNPKSEVILIRKA